MDKKYVKWILWALSILCILFVFILDALFKLGFVQTFFFSSVEMILGRELNHAIWLERFNDGISKYFGGYGIMILFLVFQIAFLYRMRKDSLIVQFERGGGEKISGSVNCSDGRNYGIDLLRCVSMFMVVLGHVVVQGASLIYTDRFSVKYETGWIILFAVDCAVNIFALISGFVGFGRKHSYTNFAVLWLTAVFYCMVATFFVVGMKLRPFERGMVLNAILPVTRYQYWYLTAYTSLFLFMPILNHALTSFSRVRLRAIVISCLLVFSVMQSAFCEKKFFSAVVYSGLWLIVLYVIGAYIRRFDALSWFTPRMALFLHMDMVLVTWVNFYLKDYFKPGYSPTFFAFISPFTCISAICFLVMFRNMSFSARMKKTIAFFAASSFSVYLIHVHPFLYDLLHFRFTFLNEYSLVVAVALIFAIAVGIYISCSLFDVIRQKIFTLFKVRERISALEKKLLD